MKLYRVVCSQLVHHECYIEANNEEEASAIAYESDGLDWKEIAYGNWDIEDVELQTEAKYSSEEV
jgi:hypothetical protein